VTEFYFNQLKTKLTKHFFFPIITVLGTKWIEPNFQLMEGDKITGYKSIMRDITERKEKKKKNESRRSSPSILMKHQML
jgi:PAS domain-containing protein